MMYWFNDLTFSGCIFLVFRIEDLLGVRIHFGGLLRKCCLLFVNIFIFCIYIFIILCTCIYISIYIYLYIYLYIHLYIYQYVYIYYLGELLFVSRIERSSGVRIDYCYYWSLFFIFCIASTLQVNVILVAMDGLSALHGLKAAVPRGALRLWHGD